MLETARVTGRQIKNLVKIVMRGEYFLRVSYQSLDFPRTNFQTCWINVITAGVFSLKVPLQVVILCGRGALVAEQTHWLVLSSFDILIFLSPVAVEL